jgi:hypothetical protein
MERLDRWKLDVGWQSCGLTKWGAPTWDVYHYKCWNFVDEALVETFSDANTGSSCAVGEKTQHDGY